LPRVNDIAVEAMLLFGHRSRVLFGKAYIQAVRAAARLVSLGEWTGSQQIATALQINPLLLAACVRW